MWIAQHAKVHDAMIAAAFCILHFRTECSSTVVLAGRERVGEQPLFVIGVAVTLVFQDLHPRLLSTIEQHADLPRPREDLWILDRRFVLDVVGPGRRVPFNHMKKLAVEITGAVEPRHVREMDDVDYERVAVPAAARVAHPPLDRPFRVRRIHVDAPDRMRVLVGNHESAWTLQDLERKPHVRGARDARQIALGFRIGGRARWRSSPASSSMPTAGRESRSLRPRPGRRALPPVRCGPADPTRQCS